MGLDHAKEDPEPREGRARLGFHRLPAGGLWVPGGRRAGQRRLGGCGAGGRRADGGGVAPRAPGRPAAHLERSGRAGAGRGAGAQARETASPLPTSPAGAHLGDSRKKRSLAAAASPGNAGGPAGRQEAAAAAELERAAPAAAATESPEPPPELGSRPAGSAPAGLPLPAACPAHLPGKPTSSRPGPRSPDDGQGVRDDPELPAAGWTRSRERVSVAPSGQAGEDTGPACGRCPSEAPGARLQPQSPAQSPAGPGLVPGRAGLRRRRRTRLANLGKQVACPFQGTEWAKPEGGKSCGGTGQLSPPSPDGPRLVTAAARAISFPSARWSGCGHPALCTFPGALP